MLVDVTFDGVSLCKGASARAEGNGWFVELEQPMPVGTLLAVSGETSASVRVERVVEGVGAGMLLVPAAAAKKAEPKTDAKPDARADAKADGKVDTKADAKVSKQPEAEADDEAEQPKTGNGTSKGPRKKSRKTVMGH